MLNISGISVEMRNAARWFRELKSDWLSIMLWFIHDLKGANLKQIKSYTYLETNKTFVFVLSKVLRLSKKDASIILSFIMKKADA